MNGQLMASCVRNIRTKNYQNLLIVSQVTVKMSGMFFGTQCSTGIQCKTVLVQFLLIFVKLSISNGNRGIRPASGSIDPLMIMMIRLSVILRTDRPTSDQPLFLEEPSWKNFKRPYLHNGARQTHGHYGPPIGSRHPGLKWSRDR